MFQHGEAIETFWGKWRQRQKMLTNTRKYYSHMHTQQCIFSATHITGRKNVLPFRPQRRTTKEAAVGASQSANSQRAADYGNGIIQCESFVELHSSSSGCWWLLPYKELLEQLTSHTSRRYPPKTPCECLLDHSLCGWRVWVGDEERMKVRL